MRVLLSFSCWRCHGRAAQPAFGQDYYRGKSITLFAGQPPGGGIDMEMRLVGQFYGRHIPGEPGIVPRNMPGAGGLILGNHLYSVARPDGLTLGMPGRSGFVLAPIISAADTKYDLRKFTWIGSSASSNLVLWMCAAVQHQELRRSQEGQARDHHRRLAARPRRTRSSRRCWRNTRTCRSRWCAAIPASPTRCWRSSAAKPTACCASARACAPTCWRRARRCRYCSSSTWSRACRCCRIWSAIRARRRCWNCWRRRRSSASP